ncbi:ead/Ea22-like family protein [Salmonella enterica]
MNIDKRALREVAERATKGEWWSDVVDTDGEYGEGEDRVSGYHSYAVYVGHESLLDMINSTAACIHTEWDHDYHMAWDETAKRNAEFIAAANPDTVLALLDENIQLQREKDAIEAVALALRDDMRDAREQLAALTAEPVSQTYELPEIIEGMEVSIDVSTCDADAGNRYFGTVTEVSELDTAKNGYILLVQDAKPNFDVNGNSPVIPGGWISCSERIPVIGELNWRTSFPLLVTCEIGVIPAYYGFVRVNGNKHYGFMESLKYGNDSGNHPQTNEYDLISNVTHWMPLPEPPQEVNRG